MNLEHLEDLLASVEKALAVPVGQRTADQSLAVAVVTTTAPEYLREMIRLRDGIKALIADERGFIHWTALRSLLDGEAKGMSERDQTNRWRCCVTGCNPVLIGAQASDAHKAKTGHPIAKMFADMDALLDGEAKG